VDGVETSGTATKVLVGGLVGWLVTEVSQVGHSGHLSPNTSIRPDSQFKQSSLVRPII
jgi:hypothetical protein